MSRKTRRMQWNHRAFLQPPVAWLECHILANPKAKVLAECHAQAYCEFSAADRRQEAVLQLGLKVCCCQIDGMFNKGDLHLGCDPKEIVSNLQSKRVAWQLGLERINRRRCHPPDHVLCLNWQLQRWGRKCCVCVCAGQGVCVCGGVGCQNFNYGAHVR